MCDVCRHGNGLSPCLPTCLSVCLPVCLLACLGLTGVLMSPCLCVADYITVDITNYAREVLQIVELAASLDEKMTPLKVVEAWMGKGPAKRRKMIQTTSLSRPEVEAIIVRLLIQGYLRFNTLYIAVTHTHIHTHTYTHTHIYTHTLTHYPMGSHFNLAVIHQNDQDLALLCVAMCWLYISMNQHDLWYSVADWVLQ